PIEDLEVPLEEPATRPEGDAAGLELPLVPARGHAEGEPPSRQEVHGGGLLGEDHGVAQRQHQYARAERHRRGPGGQRGQGGQRLQEREGSPVSEEQVVPHPQRMVAERLGRAGVGEDPLTARSPARWGEVLDREAKLDGHLVRPSGMNFGTTIVAEALPVPSDIYEMNYRCEECSGRWEWRHPNKGTARCTRSSP